MPSPAVAERTPTPDQPTATPTPFPGQGVQTLCLEAEQSYPEIEEEFSLPIAETVQRILVGLGVQVVAEGTACDAALTIGLTGEPLGESYRNAPRDPCYAGARVNGEMTLALPGRAPLTLAISGKEPTPLIAYSCPTKTEAPFDEAWASAALDGLANLWPANQVFVQALAAEDEDLSVAAAERLGEMGPEEGVVPALIHALANESWSVRDIAADALGKIGPEAKGAVPALIRALQDESPMERWQFADALGAITGQDFGEDAGRWRQWWEEQ